MEQLSSFPLFPSYLQELIKWAQKQGIRRRGWRQRKGGRSKWDVAHDLQSWFWCICSLWEFDTCGLPGKTDDHLGSFSPCVRLMARNFLDQVLPSLNLVFYMNPVILQWIMSMTVILLHALPSFLIIQRDGMHSSLCIRQSLITIATTTMRTKHWALAST